MGNTQSPTFTNVGAFLDISDMYDELGGTAQILPPPVKVGDDEFQPQMIIVAHDISPASIAAGQSSGNSILASSVMVVPHWMPPRDQSPESPGS